MLWGTQEKQINVWELKQEREERGKKSFRGSFVTDTFQRNGEPWNGLTLLDHYDLAPRKKVPDKLFHPLTDFLNVYLHKAAFWHWQHLFGKNDAVKWERRRWVHVLTLFISQENIFSRTLCPCSVHLWCGYIAQCLRIQSISQSYFCSLRFPKIKTVKTFCQGVELTFFFHINLRQSSILTILFKYFFFLLNCTDTDLPTKYPEDTKKKRSWN